MISISDDENIPRQILDRFCVVGINYDKANVEIRGAFSVSDKEFAHIAADAKQQEIRSLFTLSTCNRTEIYGFVSGISILSDLLIKHTKGCKEALKEYGYHKTGAEALRHLFKVAAGLDSQILGDYEILGQLKRAAELSKSSGLIGPLMDRVLNFAFQASKKVKTETDLSKGTVSVSFAAINLLQDIPHLSEKKTVLIGTGKFGTNVCNNLVRYFPGIQLTVINRTDTAAAQLAQKINAAHYPYSKRHEAIKDADIIIVSTNAPVYTVTKDMVSTARPQHYLDLSVPANVDPVIRGMHHITLTDVDEISSTILDKTLAARKAEMPKAIGIIDRYLADFLLWLKEYRYSLHLKTWKEKLADIDIPVAFGCEFAGEKQPGDDTAKVQRAKKALAQLAINLKERNEKGCLFINSINDYLES